MPKLSLINPSRNNLKYLKWSYESVRKNMSSEVEYCVADDFSNDGTWEWCQEKMKEDTLFKAIRNEGPTRLGHTILYDKLINEVATSEIVMIWHSDMYACPGLEDAILKYMQRRTIVSATRIEPPLHPAGPEKVICDCGIEPEEFNEDVLLSQLEVLKKSFNTNPKSYKNKITEGVFAPWAVYKTDFQRIGGHDSLFAPQSKEDSDIFNRFLLDGIEFIQTWEGFVYHMTCRGSRFADGAVRNPEGQVFMKGRETNEWLEQNHKSTRNFVRKWGSMVLHDNFMKPIVVPKYDIAFVVHNANLEMIHTIEPLCNIIYSDLNEDEIKTYIDIEQKNTKFNLRKKFKPFEEEPKNDIIIIFDMNKLTNENFMILSNLPRLIEDSGEIGKMSYDIFILNIKSLKTYENNLIKLDENLYL